MDYDKLCLSFDSHHSNCASILCDALDNRSFTDISLRAGNETFYCHKLILSNSSTYFSDLLSSDIIEDKSAVIVDLRTDPELVRSMIEFIYLGKTNISSLKMNDLLQLLGEMGVRGVSSETKQRIVEQTPDLSHISPGKILQSIGNWISSPASDYRTVPEQRDTHSPNQAHEAEPPPTYPHDELDFNESNRYKAATSRKCPPTNYLPIKKRPRMASTAEVHNEYDTKSIIAEPQPHNMKNELTRDKCEDSECSDRELLIDEGAEETPMRYRDDRMYVPDEEPCPEDLRVQARPSNAVLVDNNGMVMPSTSVSIPHSTSLFDTASPKTLLASGSNSALRIVPRNQNRTVEGSSINISNANLNRNIITTIKAETELNESLVLDVNAKQSSSKRRTYTSEQLAEAVDSVIYKGQPPIDAAKTFGIPRRTLFRHLRRRREELGIKTKDRSLPASRLSSPLPNGGNSSRLSLKNYLASAFTHPASGTHLHTILKSTAERLSLIEQNSGKENTGTAGDSDNEQMTPVTAKVESVEISSQIDLSEKK